MSRTALFCCTALALVLWAGVAYGQLFDKHPVPSGPPVLDVLGGRAAAIAPAAPAAPTAPATVVKFDEGGRIHEYDSALANHRRRRRPGRGPRHLPIGLHAGGGPHPTRAAVFRRFPSLQFHQARYDDGTPALAATRWMIPQLPARHP